ncbi:exodeoxyribonuclease V subunit gamma [Nocardioides sp. Bht2]|uniref:exodeoxyribonuclease V subunit gamma n=1 Tax=Nocardioides sp. Bht2 TaxID=3392297 RepID=UPI0039B3ED6E
MTLHLHRAERTDLLAEGLGRMLAAPLPDPFVQEVVVVPARGVERWLGQQLSHRLGVGPRGGDGVCAGVRFTSPHSLVALLLGRENDDPWHPDRLVWPVLSAIDSSLDAPWAATLAAHLGHGLSGPDAELRHNRRYSVARRLAGLFASYATQRPQLLTDWREGRDTDGVGNPLDADLRWQPELWRWVLDLVDEPAPDARLLRVVSALRDGEVPADLPPRLSLFGHTRIPASEVELLAALGRHRDVHLWLPQPSAALWVQLNAVTAAGPVARDADTAGQQIEHPLLATLGRDAVELQRTLAAAGSAVDHEPATVEEGSDTLLSRLQADLRANRVPVPGSAAPDDDSLQVHACHGPARQVEVLREVLVGLLADDTTLEPRDVLVMCPDIETYAPLIQAGFGLGEVEPGEPGHPAHTLRVRLADRSLASTNPLLAVAARLVQLAGGRVGATEVLDLLATPVVAGRFGLDTDDLATIARWVEESGVSWGMDAAGRAEFKLDSIGQNTWRAGLDRMLLGVAMAEGHHGRLGPALPLDDVSSGDVELVGRIAEYVDRVATAIDAILTATTVSQWIARLTEAVTAITRVPQRDVWLVAQFERELAAIAQSAAEETTLALSDIRTLLEHRLAGRPTRANFRTGTLTVCTMVPMRSVPHRVVCLIGLDDGIFPRVRAVDGDDALARSPRTGERDLRSEDRQLFLDAVLAATDKLVITYSGANEHSGAERPPAVPLGELIDAAKQTAPEANVVVRHPLQAFDRRNLEPGLVSARRPFSFDRAALAGARVAEGERRPRGPLLSAPLPARPTREVSLVDLQRFHAHPVREFLRSRLEVTTPLEEEIAADAIPIDLDGLAKWGVGDRLLNDVLAGLDPAESMLAEQLRGKLPPLALGTRALAEIVQNVQQLVNRTAPLRQGTPRSVDVDVDLGEGRRLTGTVTGIFGHQRVAITYSRIRAKQRLANWIDLVALAASYPDEHWTASAVGRGRAGVTQALAGPLDHRAIDHLRVLVDLYDQGMREPLPIPLETALGWAEGQFQAQRGNPADPLEAARNAWFPRQARDFTIDGDCDDASLRMVYGDKAELDVLLGPVRDDQPFAEAGHRLGQLAWRLWSPLLEGGERVMSL